MSRSKAFCTEQALAKASALFAQHGFEGTSLAMLTEALGVGKQSLYDCYGDKRALLSQCMAYAAQHFKPARHLLQIRTSGRVAIERFFAELLAECADPDHSGCLVSNLLLEKGFSDPQIQAEAAEYFHTTQTALQKQCARGIADGSIKATFNAEVLAALLMNWMSGLRISARAGLNLEMKKAHAEFIGNLLGK